MMSPEHRAIERAAYAIYKYKRDKADQEMKDAIASLEDIYDKFGKHKSDPSAPKFETARNRIVDVRQAKVKEYQKEYDEATACIK